MAKTAKKHYSIKLDEQLYEYLEKEGEKRNRSMSNIIHIILYDLKNNPSKMKAIKFSQL